MSNLGKENILKEIDRLSVYPTYFEKGSKTLLIDAEYAKKLVNQVHAYYETKIKHLDNKDQVIGMNTIIEAEVFHSAIEKLLIEEKKNSKTVTFEKTLQWNGIKRNEADDDGYCTYSIRTPFHSLVKMFGKMFINSYSPIAYLQVFKEK